MGRKRVLELEQHGPEPEEAHSPLCTLLLHKFALGKVSAVEVQQYADAAVKSGASHSDLISLQRLGGRGRSPQNTRRDLCRLHFKSLLTPVPHTVTTSVRIRGTFGEPTPVMLPHMWVQSLEHHELLQEVTAKPGDLASFWKQQDFKKNNQLLACKLCWKNVDLEGFIFLFDVNLCRLGTDLPIPWLLHGDGAPFSEVDSMQVVSMRCVISSVSIQYSEQKVQGLTAAGSLFGKLLLRVSITWRRGSWLMAHQSEKEFFLSS